MDPRLFDSKDQLVGGLFNRQPGLSGPVLPQIPLAVASELVNQPLNQAVDDVASQPISPAVIPPVGESASRPLRPRKRSRVAIEAEDSLFYGLVGAKDRREQLKLFRLYAGLGLSFARRVMAFICTQDRAFSLLKVQALCISIASVVN